MAAGNIKGIVVEIGGNTGPLDKALQGVNKTSRELQTELNQVNKLLKLDPTNTELLAQKQKLLAESVDNAKSKLDQLKEAEKQVQQQVKEGKVSEEQYRAFQREIAATETKMEGLESQAIKANAVLSDEKPSENLKKIGVAAGVAAAAAGVALVGLAGKALESADELQRQADVTGLSAERLQELQYVGNNLGVDLDTITGAQAKLTKSMAAATDGTKGTGLAFKTLGVDVKDSHGNLRDAKVVMEEAFSALGNVKNETERNALAMQLFGKSAMQLNPIISAGGDELKKLTDEARNNGAVMSNDAVAGLDTLGDTLDNLKTSILGSVGNMLAGLLPDIQKFLDNLMQLPDWIQKNSTLLEVIGVIIGTITALIIAFNIQQALATAGLTLWGAIAAGATTVTTALGAAFAFLTSPIGLIILAIGAVIAIGVLLYRNWDTIKEACIAVWGMITDKINVAIEFVKNLFNRFLEFIGGLLESIKTSFVNGWNAVATFFTETIPKIIKTIIDWFAKLPGNIWDTLVAIITKLAEWEAKVIIWIASNIAKVIKSFIDFFISLPGKVWDAVIAIIDKLGNLKDKMINWVTTEIPTFILKFVGYIAELPKKMLSIGGDIVKGIWEGIKNAADWLWDKIAGFAKWIVDGLKDFLGIKSPSKLLADEVGKFMAQGIGIGFTAEIDNVTGNMVKSLPSRRQDYIPDSTGLAAAGGYGIANMYFDLDGQSFIKAIGVPLRDTIRVKTGLKT